MSSNLSSNPVRFVIVGAGKTAVDIAQIIEQSNTANLVALLGDSRQDTTQSSLPNEADKLNIPYLETITLSDDRALNFVKAAKPDYIISANNFLLFRQAMLDIPVLSTINFHNGPLPQYAGLNPFCWAIINGDTQYGISWHVVETGIDSGPIQHIARFDIGAKPQAVTLLIKCIREGIRSFKENVLPKLLERDISDTVQDESMRRYYSKKDVPYQGLLPWWESHTNLERWARAMAFSPLPNAFYRPTLHINDDIAIRVERIRYKESTEQLKSGLIKQVNENGIIISTDGGELLVDGLFSEADEFVDPLFIGLSVGQKLIKPKQ